jgi:exosortase
VQNLANAQRAADAVPIRGKHFSPALALTVLFVGGLWFVLCRQLSGEWSVNEQYSFGWFIPFFALYLFWLRWQDAPPAPIANRQWQIANAAALPIAIATLLLLLPVRLFEIANPEWRLLAWIHALAVVTLTLFVIWCVGGLAWLRHFAFPVAFILVAVPWPTMVETPIIQSLMRVVAGVAAETAMLLGIPAHVEGNLIGVSNGLVGVNEACSGIRSLQTSLMIGLLFGELKRLSIGRRIALIAGAIAIALFANFVRAVFLVVIAATKNISEVSRWHDVAGYAIIALVFLGTMALAHRVGNRKTVAAGVSPANTSHAQPARLPLQISAALLAAALCWLLFVEIGAAAWYRIHERNLVTGTAWSVQWPQNAPNFRTLKIDEEIRSVLRFDEGHAAAWTITSATNAERSAPTRDLAVPEPQNSPMPLNASRQNFIPCLLYSFRWKPGRNSALLANLHRPDVCLPASGWTQVADDGVRNYPVVDGFQLPFRHFEFQRTFEGLAPQTAHAFYCLSEDRASGPSMPRQGANLPSMSGTRSEWTRAERLRTVLDGRRHLGQQVIEAIFISSEPFSSADAESSLRDLVPEVVVVLRQPEK